MERIQNIPKDQQLKIQESITYYAVVQLDLFLKTSTYYVKKDTIFDGNCGLQAVKVATKSELDLKSLRAKMVELIENYYHFTSTETTLEKRITSLLAIFNNDIGLLKTYFSKKIDAGIFAEGASDQTLENLSQTYTDLQEVKSLEDIINHPSLTHFIISTGLNIDYNLISIECEYGSIPEQVTKEFAISGKWVSIDCIKLVMINLGYDFKNIEQCHVENYKKYITNVLIFQKIDDERTEINIINVRLPKTFGLHWACATKNPADPDITKPTIKNKTFKAFKSLPKIIEIEDSENNEMGYELSMDNTEFYKDLLYTLKVNEDANQRILHYFDPLFESMLEVGLEDDDAALFLFMIPEGISAREDTLYKYIETFVAILEKAKITAISAQDERNKTVRIEIMTGGDILRIIKDEKDPIVGLKEFIKFVPAWENAIRTIAGDDSFSTELESTAVSLISILQAPDHNFIKNIKKYCSLLPKTWAKLKNTGFSKTFFFKIIEELDSRSHKHRFLELEFISAHIADFEKMMQEYHISPVNCKALFAQKTYSENLDEFMSSLPDIHRGIITFFNLYLQLEGVPPITEAAFIEKTYNYIAHIIDTLKDNEIKMSTAKFVSSILEELDIETLSKSFNEAPRKKLKQ